MNFKWNPPTKHPRLYHQTKSISFPQNKHASITVRVGIRRSKDVLLRFKHDKTHYRLGDKGWRDYPDPQAGKYKYEIGYFIAYEGDKEPGWEIQQGDTNEPDGWAYLPNCVAAGYIW